jgi:CBS domain containing-hemolysin-like protein
MTYFTISSVVLFFLLLALAGFFSGVETGIYVLDPVRYHLRVRERNRSALYIDWLFRDRSKLIIMLLVGTNLSVFLAAMMATNLVRRHFPDESIAYQAIITTLITAPFVLVLAEIVPKNLYRRKTDTLVYNSSRMVVLFYLLFYPAVALLSGITYLLNRILGTPPAVREGFLSRGALEHHILESAESGSITKDQQEMVQKILKLSEKSVVESMIPLEQVTMIPQSADAEHIRAVAAKKRFTRLPVYSGSRENIIGVVNIFDVLAGGGLGGSAVFWLRTVPTVSHSLRIDEALVILQTNKQPLGVVVGARNEAIGIVTVKDLLEEITGEIYVW